MQQVLQYDARRAQTSWRQRQKKGGNRRGVLGPIASSVRLCTVYKIYKYINTYAFIYIAGKCLFVALGSIALNASSRSLCI